MESTSGKEHAGVGPRGANGRFAGSLRPTRVDLGIFLVSFAVLLVELLLTRIFSVVMFHHLSFLSVSLAMMGLGLGGLVVNLAPGRFRLDNVGPATSRAAMVLAFGTVGAGAVAFHMPIGMETSAENWGKVLAVLAACLVPFTAGGVVIAHLLSRHPQRANRLYGFDLIGAALACLAFIPMTSGLGAPSALLFAGAVAALAGFVLILGAGAANLKLGYYDIEYTHGGRQRPAIVRRWNAFSRIEVVGSPEDLEREPPRLSLGYSHAVQGRRAREVHLVYDVLTALSARVASVTGVEINGLTIELMRGPFREFAGGL